MKWVLVLVAICGCDKIFGIDDLVPPPPDAPPPVGSWAQVTVGARHACALTKTGELYCWGDATTGATALATSTTTPTKITGVAGAWTAIVAGSFHTCGILDGNAYCWGRDELGEVDGANTDNTGFKQVKVTLPPSTPAVTAISAGMFSTCALAGSQLWCWGRSDLTTGSSQQPVQVMGQWSAVAVGTDHTCALAPDGGVWCWGRNDYEQASPSAANPIPQPTRLLLGPATMIASGTQASCAVLATGELWCWGITSSTGLAMEPPAPIDGTDWTGVVVGSVLVCGTRGGSSYCWGSAQLGGLGDGQWAETIAANAAHPIIADVIATSHSYESEENTCAISHGNMSCWGDNRGGILGVHASLHSIPIEVASPVTGTWQQLAVGFEHTCAIDSANNAWCWGDDDDGQISGATCAAPPCSQTALTQLGSASAIVAGANHTCFLSGTTINCLGANDHGQLGSQDQLAHKTSPVTGATSLVGGAYATCATSGHQLCWGLIENGTVAFPTQRSSTFDTVGFGVVADCGLSNHSRTCAGYNYFGDLGDGGMNQSVYAFTGPSSEGSYQTLSFTTRHACATVDNYSSDGRVGEVTCWGTNYNGESQPQLFGVEFVVSPSLVPGLSSCTAVSTGSTLSCAICNDQPECWGSNRNGTLGRGGVLYAAAGPGFVDLAQRTWTRIASGNNHSCALAATGELACWGLGVHGELGDGGHGSSVPVAISAPN